MTGSGIKTIVVDSLTAIISPLVVQAVIDNDAGINRNKVAAYKPKAMAMRLLQDSITGWGTDTLWIYHTSSGMDAQAHQVTSTSISGVELARLHRSLNMTLRVEASLYLRSVTVDWARNGRSGITLDDTTGCWRGMPERIELAVYDGLTADEQESIAKATPTAFASKEDAIAWMWESGIFKDPVHAANRYEKIKREQTPSVAQEMWELVIHEVLERKAAAASTYNPFDDDTVGVGSSLGAEAAVSGA
jgi:hypothetical protein